ncbi:MAG TPA: nicotinate (nicotinamide) nucleotide adenylyltransferase [Mariprofundaceae bacterium]|nr:nicotinate (nicotinamide) nucleotide adenylyltransferase [Mariprofundaceae bacterium]
MSHSSETRIGLFGGRFDPPHMGHEALVRSALTQLKLDEVWVIPTGIPVHRDASRHASGEMRMAWAEMMFKDLANVRIKDWEVSHDEPVAAIDTLKRFRENCPELIPLWLCGADSFATMPQWIGYPEHQRCCNVAVFSRKGEPSIVELSGWRAVSLEQWLSSRERDQSLAAGHVIRLDGMLPDVSATVIRDRAMRGESLNGLVNSRICKEVETRYGPESGERV